MEKPWRLVLILLAMAAIVWWVWHTWTKEKPTVPLQSNPVSAPPTPAGIPLTLTQKMARVTDIAIPVVMTSGTQVEYDDDEVNQLVRRVLSKLNAMGEQVSLIKTVSVSKTQDSYKTVAYDIIMNAYDAVHNIGLMLALSILVPVSGQLYVRQLRMYHDAETATNAGPGAASDPVGYAPYENAMDVLAAMKPGA
jgi:hypothetical protein